MFSIFTTRRFCITINSLPMNPHSLLTNIETKIKKLKSYNERLEKDNAELKTSVFTYLQKIDEQKKELERTKMELQALQLGKSTDMHVEQLRKELDHYIYLIDKCMASILVK